MNLSFSDGWQVGRILVLLGHLSLFAFAIYLLFDKHHFLNADWHIHAQFHVLWTALMMSILGASGMFVVLHRWQTGTTRSIFRWIPVFVWASYLIGQLIMALLPSEEPLFQARDLVGGIGYSDLLIVVMLILSYLGVLLDTQTDKGPHFHFTNFSSF
ncbi:MAG: hypothetical protein AAF587_41685 [Bacteroidota bacterium]